MKRSTKTTLILISLFAFFLPSLYSQVIVASSTPIPPLCFGADYTFDVPELDKMLKDIGISSPDWVETGETQSMSTAGGLQFYQTSTILFPLPLSYNLGRVNEVSLPSGFIFSFTPTFDYAAGPQFTLNYRARAGLCINLGYPIVALNGFYTKSDVTFPEEETPERFGGVLKKWKSGVELEISFPQYISVGVSYNYVHAELPTYFEYGGWHFGINVYIFPYAHRAVIGGWN